MKRRNIIFAVALLLAIAMLGVLAGCGGNSGKSISSIAIAEGSFKTVYDLDEVPDYSSAILVVTYTNGNKENVSITADMVSGLTTSRTVSGAVLTVTYRGMTATFMYKVIGTTTNVDTAVRLKLSSAISEDGRNHVVSVKMTGVEQEENGIYAVKFRLTGIDGVNIGEAVSSLTDDYAVKIYTESKSSISVVIYSVSGYLSFGENMELITVKVTKSSNSVTLNAQSVSVSDGTRDYTVPGASITIQ